jgi:putative membrane protein
MASSKACPLSWLVLLHTKLAHSKQASDNCRNKEHECAEGASTNRSKSLSDNVAPVWKNLIAGAVGGLVASFVMNQYQAAISKASEAISSSGEGNDEEKSESSGGDDATVKAAEGITETVAGRSLSEDEKQWAGPSVHYGFGTLVGATYGALASLVPGSTLGYGTIYGAGLWLVADEVGVPALGLSAPPTETPVSSHVNAFGSHLVYGLTTDLVRRFIVSQID